MSGRGRGLSGPTGGGSAAPTAISSGRGRGRARSDPTGGGSAAAANEHKEASTVNVKFPINDDDHSHFVDNLTRVIRKLRTLRCKTINVTPERFLQPDELAYINFEFEKKEEARGKEEVRGKKVIKGPRLRVIIRIDSYYMFAFQRFSEGKYQKVQELTDSAGKALSDSKLLGESVSYPHFLENKSLGFKIFTGALRGLIAGDDDAGGNMSTLALVIAEGIRFESIRLKFVDHFLREKVWKVGSVTGYMVRNWIFLSIQARRYFAVATIDEDNCKLPLTASKDMKRRTINATVEDLRHAENGPEICAYSLARLTHAS